MERAIPTASYRMISQSYLNDPPCLHSLSQKERNTTAAGIRSCIANSGFLGVLDLKEHDKSIHTAFLTVVPWKEVVRGINNIDFGGQDG